MIRPADVTEIHLVTDDGVTPTNFAQERRHCSGLDKCKISVLPNISSVLALVESGRSGTVLQGFSLKHLSFPYVAIPLDYYLSLGLICRSSDKRPAMRRFLERCKKHAASMQ